MRRARGKALPVDDLQPLLPVFGVVLPKDSRLSGGSVGVDLRARGPLDALVISGPVTLDDSRLAGYSLGSKLGGVLSLSAAEQALGEGFEAVVMARSLVHDPALVSKWRADATHRSACNACNRCVAAMYGGAGTYCTETGNQIDIGLNRTYAGEELTNAA